MEIKKYASVQYIIRVRTNNVREFMRMLHSHTRDVWDVVIQMGLDGYSYIDLHDGTVEVNFFINKGVARRMDAILQEVEQEQRGITEGGLVG